MVSKNFTPVHGHLTHCAMLCFRNCGGATEAHRRMCSVHDEDALSLRIVELSFEKFSKADFGTLDIRGTDFRRIFI
ncbi:hypothetical protein M514_08328 [Trichuris suis]|uniref:Mos1 transposase HTH domain-containing protein n=1 Tax=Trichuris suis TaxID=68888 RepID=A0A085M0P1_9BILA|nr:hypothetical protein M513_08328 [Trichuris suis]KFD63409.1 hypothetical protein M514_08328 [Trichuris suis]